MSDNAMRQTLRGAVERVTYVAEETGWSVVKLHVPRRTELVTVVGNLLGVQPGENLEVRGVWVRDRTYGEQFKAESYMTVKPATLVGLEKYLGSGLVRGMGKVMAGRLVKRFGLETLDVIENQPQRLTHVRGIGPKRKARILEAWEEHKAIKEVMLFLQTHGVSPAYAVKICKRYGQGAVQTVRDNPYQLAVDIFGIGFKTADKIAESLGIARDSPQRVRAGVLHVLGQLSDAGHVYCPRPRLVQQAAEILEVDEQLVEQAIEVLHAEELAVVEALEGADDPAVYSASLHRAETGAARLLQTLLTTAPQPLIDRSPHREGTGVGLDVPRALAAFEARRGLTLHRQQRQAVEQAAGPGKVLIITGGPGTGKTTILEAILQLLDRAGQRLLLCAPTGRAAKRMSETTGREAATIHRLLEFNPRRGRFERDGEAPLEGDVVVVDEVSMVDTVLLYNLLKAVPPAARLILVGDVDQLPSVGPGNVLRDLIRSGAPSVVTLTEVFRQAEQSLVVVNAHRVNQGHRPRSGADPDSDDFFFIEREEPEAALDTLKKVVSSRIPRSFQLDARDDVQVLTPMRRGTLGADNLNEELQQLLNPSRGTPGQELTRGSRTYRVGDKVMQLRNNYDLEVYNGDIGRIEAIDEVERQLTLRVDDRQVTYDLADLDELALAYACTVHKSQGSEYPAVVLTLHTQHYPMLQRNLLYTAITRGRRLVVVIGSRRALSIALRNASVGRRHTHLAERLARAAMATFVAPV